MEQKRITGLEWFRVISNWIVLILTIVTLLIWMIEFFHIQSARGVEELSWNRSISLLLPIFCIVVSRMILFLKFLGDGRRGRWVTFFSTILTVGILFWIGWRQFLVSDAWGVTFCLYTLVLGVCLIFNLVVLGYVPFRYYLLSLPYRMWTKLTILHPTSNIKG
jgi:hypothetical protein